MTTNWKQLRTAICGDAAISMLTTEESESIRDEFPGIPDDYLSFLTDIGWGELEILTIYSGPIPAPEIYGPRGHLSQIILIGDDRQGYCDGFDTGSDYALTEISPSGEVEELNMTFFEFMQSRSRGSL